MNQNSTRGGKACYDTTANQVINENLESHSNVLVLSKTFQLTADQRSLLEKGLTFIPRPTVNGPDSLRRDMQVYHRRIKLIQYFGNESAEFLPFITTSTWQPDWPELSRQVKKLIRKDNKSCPIVGAHHPDTINIVYGITCNTCKKVYVGETGFSIRVRLQQHLYSFTKTTGTSELIRHFQIHPIDKLSITILESQANWTVKQRRMKERQWIRNLGTLKPGGLNDR